MAIVVLVELSARNDAAFPSLRWLSQHLGCSPGSVRHAIREAEESGLVRRVERYDTRDFSGGRQTSNRYEIVLHPGLELVEGLGHDRNLVIVDDEADPNQLELTVEPIAQPQPEIAPRPALVGQPQGLGTLRQALGPALAKARPSEGHEAVTVPSESTTCAPVAEPATATVARALDRPPLHDSIAPPSKLEEGVKDLREKKERTANSTGAREPVPQAGEASRSAAAFLGEVLSDERARGLKQRFGHNAFGSLLFAMRRNECRAHPATVRRALERLCAATDVANPGGYFFRVFQDELAAAELAGPPNAEDLRLEAARDRREALKEHARTLRERLERVQSTDFEAAARIRAELEPLYAKLRADKAPKGPSGPRPAPKLPPPPVSVYEPRRAPTDGPPPSPELAEAMDAAMQALELIRKKGPATTAPCVSLLGATSAA